MISIENAILMKHAIIHELTSKREQLIERMKLQGDVSDELTPKIFIRALLAGIQNSTVILWDINIWNAAIRKADVAFPVVKLNMNSIVGENGIQLWMFSGAHMQDFNPNDWNTPFDMVLDAILVSVHDNLLEAVWFFAPAEDRDFNLNRCHYIRAIGSVNDGQLIDARYSSVCAALYFLGLKLTRMEEPRIKNKSKLRRILRNVGEIPKIRIVTLRKFDSSASGNSKDVVWQHKWIVSGHWRSQWYPSSQKHEPLYIEPYVKGPDDKPLLAPREIIYKTVR